jgi:hypothetical protein
VNNITDVEKQKIITRVVPIEYWYLFIGLFSDNRIKIYKGE